MLNKVYKIASSAFLSIILFSSIIFIGSNSAYAIDHFKIDTSFSAINLDNEQSTQPLETSNQETNITNEKNDLEVKSDSKSTYPDLGDDQVFPFVAGLDSSEGS